MMGLATSSPSQTEPGSMGVASSAHSQTESAEDTIIEYCGFDISALPNELFLQVLVFVPAEQVVKQCSLVCKDWLQASRDLSMWRQKCERSRRYVARFMGPPPENFMVFYFKNPYTRNLLKNTHATEGQKHWETQNQRWVGVSVEQSRPHGSDPIEQHVPSEEIGGRKVDNWVTSYIEAFLCQRVSLLDEGCSEEALDKLKFPIHVSAWCSARWDCGAKFWLRVRLLDKAGQEVDKTDQEKDLRPSALRKAWHKVEHTFENYGSGVRTVEFTMGGVDTQFWAGNYGPKFTLPCLRFLLQE